VQIDEGQAKAKATADPFGMTTKRQTTKAKAKADSKAKASQILRLRSG
jgi:hypothetical protein